MRFLPFALATTITLAVTPENSLQYRNDICKVLSGDPNAACIQDRHCIAPDPYWYDFTTKETEHYCNSKAVFGLEDEYEEQVRKVVAPLLVGNGAWAHTTDCTGFVARFGTRIDLFMKAVLANVASSTPIISCSPAQLNALIHNEDGAHALEGILKMYSLFPLSSKLVLGPLDADFVATLEAAKAAFPLNIATDSTIVDGELDVNSHARFVLGETQPDGTVVPFSAAHWMLLKANQPLNMSFGNVVDLIIEIHSHLRSPSFQETGTHFLEKAWLVPERVKNWFKSQYVEEIAAHNAVQEELKDKLRAAMGGLQAVVLKMVEDMNEDSVRLTSMYHEYAEKVKKDGSVASRNVMTGIIHQLELRNEWLATHYKSILVYFIYLWSEAHVSLSPAAQARWNVE